MLTLNRNYVDRVKSDRISSIETPKPCSLQPSCSHIVGERFEIVHEKMSACME